MAGKSIVEVIIKYILIVICSTFYVAISAIGWFKSRNKPSRPINMKEEPSILQDPALGKHGTIRLPGRNIEMHYVANGERSKPLMLLVHGFPEFWYTWRHQLVEFSKDYYTVAVDMTGYGGSTIPKDLERYDSVEIAEDIKEFILALGYEKCTLVAHDWGAAVSFVVASNFGDVVEKLIIMNGPSKRGMARCMSFTQLLKTSYMFFFAAPYLAEYVLGRDQSSALKLFNKARKMLTDEEIDAYRYTFTKNGFTGPLNYYRFSLLRRGRTVQREIKAPTLIIWGTADTALGKEIAEASGKDCKTCEIKYIEGSTHWVNQEFPDEVNRLMRDYLKC